MKKAVLKIAGRITGMVSVIGSLLLLTGCISFGAKPPPSLLVLTSLAKVAGGTIHGGPQTEALVIFTPAVPRKLDTNRLPVQIDGSSIGYLKNAVWSDKPASLMQQLLIETITARNGRFILNEADADGLENEILSGSLIEFGIDARTNEAIVIYDAVRMVRGQSLQKQRFEARRPVSLIEAVPASAALNGAANDVADQIALWLKG